MYCQVKTLSVHRLGRLFTESIAHLHNKCSKNRLSYLTKLHRACSSYTSELSLQVQHHQQLVPDQRSRRCRLHRMPQRLKASVLEERMPERCCRGSHTSKNHKSGGYDLVALRWLRPIKFWLAICAHHAAHSRMLMIVHKRWLKLSRAHHA